MELVSIYHAFNRIGQLVLYITRSIIELLELVVFLLLLFFGRMQTVFCFQFPCNVLAPAVFKLIIQFFAILVHPQGYDMQVMTVDVFVLVNHVGLITIAQLLHIFLCNFR